MSMYRRRTPKSDKLIHEIMDNDTTSQFRCFKRLIRVDGHVFRTEVRLDTSVPRQSSAELAVFIPGVGFSVLLDLHGSEIGACRDYHGHQPVGRADKVQGWLHDTDSQLLEIGRQIMREG